MMVGPRKKRIVKVQRGGGHISPKKPHIVRKINKGGLIDQVAKGRVLHCAPDREGNKLTCYTKEDLVFLADSYNKKRAPDRQIPLTLPKAQLWKAINSRLKNECTNEWCWLEKDFVPAPYAKKIVNETFRPEMPEDWKGNPFEWLTTVDIKKIMKQYEKKYPNFLFIGPVPVDCPTAITCPLSGLDVSVLVDRLGKTKLGVIYNLDPHDKPGSHWVAMYADFRQGKIFYFDSVGIAPPKPIRAFLGNLKASIEKWNAREGRNVPVEVMANRTRFQYGSSECGVFSMYFIISNLNGEGFQPQPHKISDKMMNQLRKVLYRPPNNK